MLESLVVMDKNAIQLGAEKMELRRKISDYAKQLGFDLCGFTKAKIDDKYLAVFENWLAQGLHSDMSYMEKIEQRRNMQEILPGAQSVVVLAVNYNREQTALAPRHGRVARYAYGRDYHKVIGAMLKKLEGFICGLGIENFTSLPSPSCKPGSVTDPATLSSAPAPTPSPETAPVRCKSYVDTGPVMERALAEQAGLGQIGKNGCLITREFGSWVFLSEVITTLDLNAPQIRSAAEYPEFIVQDSLPRGKNTESQNGLSEPLNDSKSVRAHTSAALQESSPGRKLSDKYLHVQTFASDSGPTEANLSSEFLPRGKNAQSQLPVTHKVPHPCGNCTKCITACPTGAIIRPGVIDARLCISYLTIENRDKIPPHLAAKIKETQRIFGCDICQEVCPHNIAKGKPLTNEGLQNAIAGDQLSVKEILEMENDPGQHESSQLLSAKAPKHSLSATDYHGELSTPDQAFLARFAGSPVMRAKRAGLTRNLKILE